MSMGRRELALHCASSRCTLACHVTSLDTWHSSWNKWTFQANSAPGQITVFTKHQDTLAASANVRMKNHTTCSVWIQSLLWRFSGLYEFSLEILKLHDSLFINPWSSCQLFYRHLIHLYCGLCGNSRLAEVSPSGHWENWLTTLLSVWY